ncbi:hypothetical protein PINS_up010276 [Pythium insidiosum]|nr:hypothetical protein PINS_up010276 [Pythium insidiosum]
MSKQWIDVAILDDDSNSNEDRGRAASQRVWWYMGTSDAMIESAIRMLLRLPRDTQFLLRDSDGHLVPVSGVLPPSSAYQVVVMNADAALSSSDGSGGGGGGCAVPSLSRSLSRKRPRAELQSVGDAVDDRQQDERGVHASASTAMTVTRPRTIVDIVTKFVAVFTRAISNDDNVNFVPSSGEYSLYALYCRVFAGTALFPKSTNSFYKITSAQGRIDRQRVMRYYQHTTATGHVECVEYKPEGKGPLLRKYAPADTEEELAALVSAAVYVGFLHGFRPISKATFRASTVDRQLHPQH